VPWQVEKAKAYMNTVIYPMFKSSKAKVKTQVVQIGTGGSENIGEAICHEADVTDTTMIVMASRSRTSMAKWFLGSVAEYVIRHSKVAVSVVPLS